MKTHYFPTRLASFGLLVGMLGLLASCGASQSTASGDGIYGDGQRNQRQTSDSGSGYKQYFNSLQDSDIITDVEQYSSVNDSTQTERGYANGQGSWEGSADNVTINVYDNNWGMGYWNNYWYSPYWNTGWGWNSWYGPGWGWGFNYGWGWNSWYGGWGGYPYYGGYYGGYPYHYGYAQNYPRGTRGYVSPGRRDNVGRQYSSMPSGRRNLTYSTNGTRGTRYEGTRGTRYDGTRGTRTFTNNNGTRSNSNGVRTYNTPRNNNQNYNTPRNSQPTRSYSAPSAPTRSYSPSPSGGGGRSSGGGSYGGGGGRSGGGGGGRR
ncbi:hypothetical protein [Flavobacterium selenitireducens]|uniref:hypothetical protein n=1 Tax=Flavobacterium selenitireducens TaxID=2722704 RepID=UPI00168BC337|nr:hypothetical protein [Flavobacterium selenitireducens]MBD3582583.1 hypothetical protein [Flavobacterium selenitireducens]